MARLAETAALLFTFLGISLLAVLSSVAVLAALIDLSKRKPIDQLYTDFRKLLTRAILAGLEMLVVADMIWSAPLNRYQFD